MCVASWTDGLPVSVLGGRRAGRRTYNLEMMVQMVDADGEEAGEFGGAEDGEVVGEEAYLGWDSSVG